MGSDSFGLRQVNAHYENAFPINILRCVIAQSLIADGKVMGKS